MADPDNSILRRRCFEKDQRIAALEAEVARLRALVREAFDEGMQAGGQGEYFYSPHDVDRYWAESGVKSELEGDA